MKPKLIQKEAAKLTAGIEDWELEDDLQDAFIEGALWAEKAIIDKACEWLEKNVCIGYNFSGDKNTLTIIDDFRKAMKGE